MSSPNDKRLLEEVRDIMGLKHYSIHTERSYCDWIRKTHKKGVRLTKKAINLIEYKIYRITGIEKWAVDILCDSD